VHEHGGRIELREHHGPGAIFDLWLPRARDGSGLVALIEDGDGEPDDVGEGGTHGYPREDTRDAGQR